MVDGLPVTTKGGTSAAFLDSGPGGHQNAQMSPKELPDTSDGMPTVGTSKFPTQGHQTACGIGSRRSSRFGRDCSETKSAKPCF